MNGYVQYVIRTYHELDSGVSIFIFLTILALIYYRCKFLELALNKHIWGAVAMLHCIAMISGYSWNVIKKPVFCFKTEKGPVLISSNPKTQYVAESCVVAVLNATIVIGMILSIEAQRKGKRQLQFVGLALMFASFALLLAVFRVKRPWYRYGWVRKNIKP